jgi:hypothetical protein
VSLFDDFKKASAARSRRNFDSFEKSVNEAFRAQGSERRLRDLIPGETQEKAKETPAEDLQMADAFEEIMALTTDSDAKSAMARAVMVYRSIVRCAKAGGSVKFVDVNGAERVLKVRIR